VDWEIQSGPDFQRIIASKFNKQHVNHCDQFCLIGFRLVSRGMGEGSSADELQLVLAVKTAQRLVGAINAGGWDDL